MLRTRVRVDILLSVVLLAFLLSTNACTVEESAAEGATVEDAAAEVEGVASQEQEVDAETALVAALVEAEKDGRLVFLHTGADW